MTKFPCPLCGQQRPAVVVRDPVTMAVTGFKAICSCQSENKPKMIIETASEAPDPASTPVKAKKKSRIRSFRR